MNLGNFTINKCLVINNITVIKSLLSVSSSLNSCMHFTFIIYYVSKYLLNTYYESGTVLDIANTAVNKT